MPSGHLQCHRVELLLQQHLVQDQALFLQLAEATGQELGLPAQQKHFVPKMQQAFVTLWELPGLILRLPVDKALHGSLQLAQHCEGTL